MCNGNCATCRCRIKATSITNSGGISIITIPDTEFTTCGYWCIGLFTPIPVGTDCSRVQIVSNAITYDVLTECGNYWRPCELKCRSMLQLKFCDDPAHFVISKVKGRR